MRVRSFLNSLFGVRARRVFECKPDDAAVNSLLVTSTGAKTASRRKLG